MPMRSDIGTRPDMADRDEVVHYLLNKVLRELDAHLSHTYARFIG